MKLKRIMASILAICIVLSTMGTVVFAEDANVASVDGVEYTDIQEAIKAAAPNGKVEVINNIVVDEWVMFAESLSIGNGNLITLNINGLTINGNNHSLTVNSIESAGNGGRLFYDATNLNINNLTINYAEGVTGGIGLKSGTINDVTFNGGVYGILPQDGDITINDCTFATNGTAIYYEDARDNLKVTNNTFNQPDGEEGANVILLRGNTVFTGNTINSGRTVNVVCGSPIVTGNDFGNVRFKVYNDATAKIENNKINFLEFKDNSEVKSAFGENTLSEDATQVLKDAGVIEEPVLLGSGTETDPYLISSIEDLKTFRDDVNAGDTYQDKYVLLNADITFDEDYKETNVNYQGNNVSSRTFRPIGDYTCSASFKGTFNGGNHTISGLYISGWDINYHWDNYGCAGLFGTIENATIKNLTMKNIEIQVEGGDVAGIAGHAIGDCTFENIIITNSKIATYNNGCAGIIAWSEAGDYTFKNVTVDDKVVLAGLWGSFDSSIGGVVAQADTDGTYTFENVTVACRLDCYNDVTASYKWYSYRMCGMLIGRMTTLFDGTTDVDPRNSVTLKNVYITIGEWANYTYIWDDSLSKGCQRVEPGYTYGGVNVENYPDAEIESIGFKTIIGGPQSQSKGYYGSDVNKLQAIEDFDTSTLYVEDLAKVARCYVSVYKPADVARSTEWILVDSYDSFVSALAAAQDGYMIKFTKDADIGQVVIDGKTVIIELNGHTIKGALLPSTGNITIQNGSIVNADSAVSAIEINSGALTLTDVNIDSARHSVRIDGAVTADINGGTYRSAIGTGTGTYHAINVSGNADVTINNGTFTGPKGTTADSGSAVNVQVGSTVTIEGGKFSGGKINTLSAKGTLTVSGGLFDQDPTAYLLEGYKAVLNSDGMYSIRKLLPGQIHLIINNGIETIENTEHSRVTLLSPIDTLNYKSVGFDCTLTNGDTKEWTDSQETNIVYESVTDNTDKKYTSDDMGVDNGYIFALNILLNPEIYNEDTDTKLYARAFAVDKDGNRIDGIIYEFDNLFGTIIEE